MISRMRSAMMLLGLAALVFAVFVPPAGAQSAPGPVATVTVVPAAQNAAHDKLTVSWSSPDGNGQSGFRVQYSKSGAFATGVTTVAVAGTATSYVIGNLPKGAVYYVRVQAYNGAGGSDYTNASPFPIVMP